MPSAPLRRSPATDKLVRFGLPFAFTALAYLLTAALPQLGERPFYLAFMAAVAGSAWFGGALSGLLATLLSVLASMDFLFKWKPPTTLLTAGGQEILRLSVFLEIALLACWMVGRLRSTQDALRGSEERYRQLAETAPDAILTIDEDTNILFVNGAAESLFGYTSEDMLGKKLSLLVRSHLAQAFERGVKGHITGARLCPAPPLQVCGLHKEGHEVPLEVSLGEFTKDGKRFFTAFARDLSERKRAEEALRASQKLAMEGRLIDTVASEIRNPAESAQNLLSVVEMRTLSDETARQAASLAREKLARMQDIIRQMAGFYRDSPQPVPVNLCDVLERVLALHTRDLQSRPLKIEKRYQFRGEIQAYRGEMRQVFSALVGAALEAGKWREGKMVLHVFPSRDWRNPSQGGVRVVVADNGSGLGANQRCSLFNPFRLPGDGNGHGVALWMAQAMVQKHGGWLQVRSSVRPGRTGTCYSVFLPIAAASRQVSGVAAGSQAA